MVDPIEIYFDDRKEHRTWYLETYTPPSLGGHFAILSLTILDESEPSKITTEMEDRTRWWYEHYRIPLMTTATRKDRKSVGIKEITGHPYLVAFSKSRTDPLTIYWESIPDSSFPQENYSNGELLSVYADFENTTGDRLRKKHDYDNRALRCFLWVSRLLTIVVPTIWLIYEELFGPEWFAYAVLGYGLLKYGRSFLLSTGLMKLTKNELAANERKRLEEQYIHHCDKNPKGFEKLRRENNQQHIKERDERREKELLDKKNGTKD